MLLIPRKPWTLHGPLRAYTILSNPSLWHSSTESAYLVHFLSLASYILSSQGTVNSCLTAWEHQSMAGLKVNVDQVHLHFPVINFKKSPVAAFS